MSLSQHILVSKLTENGAGEPYTRVLPAQCSWVPTGDPPVTSRHGRRGGRVGNARGRGGAVIT